MKILNRSAMCLAAVILVIAMPSCGKKWKKPTSVSYQFRLKDNSSSGLIKFTSASLRVSELKFDGERKQGQKHVEMKQSFDPPLQVPLSLTPTTTDILFYIPQGTYHTINLDMKINGEMGTGPSLVVNGYFIKNGYQSIPVKFEYYSEQSFSLPASNPSGDNIVLVEDQPASATILMNPYYWFQEVPESVLSDAELSTNWSDTVMVINPDHNVNIYQMVIDRLAAGNEVVF